MNNVTNLDMNNFTSTGCDFRFEEGDLILITTSTGQTFTGVFLRIQGNFVLWVRVVNNVPRITLTSLTNITITKL